MSYVFSLAVLIAALLTFAPLASAGWRLPGSWNRLGFSGLVERGSPTLEADRTKMAAANPGEPGYALPALAGQTLADVQTPCLAVDLNAFDRNLARMADAAKAMGVNLRPHGKAHKTPAIALAQIKAGAVGICAQKVSEAEAFVRAGVMDVTVTNQVSDPAKIRRLAALPLLGARVSVCADNADAIRMLGEAVTLAGTDIGVLIEVECGGARCGVSSIEDAVTLGRLVASTAGLRLDGIQAYNGGSQHVASGVDRQTAARRTVEITRGFATAFRDAGLPCHRVTGGGTGTFEIEGRSDVFTEIQPGSYALMDEDYGRLTDGEGRRLDQSGFENALFVMTQVMSVARAHHPVCDAGLKSMSMESGLPRVFDRPRVTYVSASDEHGVLSDPAGTLSLNDKLRLVPGHVDPTCNLHDWIVAYRGDRVEAVWPVSARGKSF